MQFLANLDFQPARYRLIQRGRLQAFRKIIFSGGKAIGLIVGVAVAFAIVQLLHEFGWRIAQVQRHGAAAIVLHQGPGAFVGDVAGIAFGRSRQVQHGLGQGQFAFRAAQALIGVRGIIGHLQGPGVCQANVFPGHAHNAPRQIAWISPAIEHAHQPVQGGIGVGAAHAFVQGADGVVELFAALVVAAQLLAQHLL